MSKVLPCLFAVLVAGAGRCVDAGTLAKADPPPPGLSQELKVQHPTGSNEVRCYLQETEIDVERPSCVAQMTNTVTLIFEGFWQDRETVVRVTEPGGQAHDFRAVNGAIFKLLMVPGKQVGLYTVTATQRGGRRGGSFILKWTSQPTVSVRNTNVIAGDTAEYMLSGFEPEQSVELFVYRANGVTSYNGMGSSFFDFVTGLEPVVTDARGEAMLSIPTDREDPTGHYILVTGPDAPRGDAATNQFWLAGGRRAPAPTRYAEQRAEQTRMPQDGDVVARARRSSAARVEPEETQAAAAQQVPLESSRAANGATISAEEAAGLKTQLEQALAQVDLSLDRAAPGVLLAPDAPATRATTPDEAAGAETVAEPAPRVPPLAPVASVADTPVERLSTTAAIVGEVGTDDCGEAKVSGVSALSIRAEPSLSSDKVGFASEGRSVQILCDAKVVGTGRAWLHIRNSLGIEGWMSDKYLIVTETRAAEPAQSAVEPAADADTGAVAARALAVENDPAADGTTTAAPGSAADDSSASEGDSVAEARCGYASVVDVASLAVRDAPSLDAKLIGSVARGERTELLCVEPLDTPERTWIRVQTQNGLQGWMSARYLKLWD